MVHNYAEQPGVLNFRFLGHTYRHHFTQLSNGLYSFHFRCPLNRLRMEKLSTLSQHPIVSAIRLMMSKWNATR